MPLHFNPKPGWTSTCSFSLSLYALKVSPQQSIFVLIWLSLRSLVLATHLTKIVMHSCLPKELESLVLFFVIFYLGYNIVTNLAICFLPLQCALWCSQIRVMLQKLVEMEWITKQHAVIPLRAMSPTYKGRVL